VFHRGVCQRTIESLLLRCGCAERELTVVRAGTWGSRKPGHRISGSVRSIGLSTPWCSIFSFAVSSRK
jgi:hypothetical protein